MVSTPRMTRIADLWQLQEIDSALDSRRASLEDAQADREDDPALVDARASVDAIAIRLREAQTAQKDLELESDSVRAKIAPAETKLYSGSIKNPKELADLQADVEALKRQLSAIEDRDIAALDAVEREQAALRAATEQRDALQAAADAERAELDTRIARLTQEIAGLEPQRKEAAALIDAELMRVYEHTRRTHQGRGVARLDRNLCLGCRISLPVSTVNKARSAAAFVQCPNCERILYPS
jgi:predicted  nucleic acid-binding Zn-ribbon protein